ncbi:MAG: RDD family protein, partial [[Clostridium] innocuum]|nr:RDD family protein [[Clostridium] innocuum]MDY3045214.1 RDD family protein [[Clostridium] innocuum]
MQLNMTGLYTKLYAITDHTPCDVDTPKRFGAYILDWVVGGIFTGLPAVLLYSGLTKKQDMFGGLYVFESLGYARSWAFLAGALCILFALFYYVYVPWRIWPGQTLGKRVAGYRMEKTDGTAVDLITLLKRQ